MQALVLWFVFTFGKLSNNIKRFFILCFLIANMLFCCYQLQRINIDSTPNSYVDIHRGIPQGSMLKQVFINGFMFFISEAEVCNFAEDTAVYLYSLNYGEANPNCL